MKSYKREFKNLKKVGQDTREMQECGGEAEKSFDLI